MSKNSYVNPWMLDGVHAKQNAEKAYAALLGFLTAAAAKPTLDTREMDILTTIADYIGYEVCDQVDGFDRFEAVLLGPDPLNDIPAFAKSDTVFMRALAVANRMNPDNWFSTSIQGTMEMINADGVIDKNEQDLINKLKQMDLRPVDKGTLDNKSIYLDIQQINVTGATIVLTGDFDRPRKEIVAMIESANGRVTSAVSKKTSYVVSAEIGNAHWSTKTAGTKILKALDIGVPIITERVLLASLTV